MSAEKQKVASDIGLDPTGEHYDPSEDEPATKLVAPLSKKKKKVDPLLGTVIGGRYRIQSKLGQGGMGVVYKGRQEAVERDVAIKILLHALVEDETLVQRFHLEARAASRLSHPNTITIYDFGQHEELLYIAMEYLDGQPLNEPLKQGPMPPARVLHIIMQTLRSLSEAHKKGIVHRDIKPDNIYLTEMGGVQDFVKVLDFGVAKIKTTGEKTLTKAGMIFGTPKYMSPEQARSQNLDARSDVYAIGVMMYQMLMGRVPFDADDHVTILLKHVTEPPPPFEGVRSDLHVPKEFQDVVFRAMEKDVKNRYQSADEMLMALERLAMQLQIPLGTAAFPIMATGVQPMATASYPPGSGATPTPTPGMPSPTPTPVPGDSPITGEHPNTTGGVSSLDEDSSQPGMMDLGITVMPGAMEAIPELAPTPSTPTHSSNALIFGGVAAIILAIGIGVGAFFAFGGNNDADPDPVVEPPVTKEEPKTPPKEIEEKVDPPIEAVADKGDEDKAEGDEGDKGTPSEKKEEGAEEDKKDAAAAAKEEEKDKPTEAATVSIQVLSFPIGAEVLEGGRSLGTTPLSLTRARSSRKLKLTFKKTGFKSKTQSTSLRSNDVVKAILQEAGVPTNKETPKVDNSAGGGSEGKTPAGSSNKEDIENPY